MKLKILDWYDYYKNKFPDPVKGRVDPKDPDYENQVSLYHAWNKATQNAVFFMKLLKILWIEKNL